MRYGLLGDVEPLSLEVRDDGLSSLLGLHPAVLRGHGVAQGPVGVEDVDLLELVALPDFEVVRIVGWSDLDQSRTELAVHVGIGDNRDEAVRQGEPGLPPDEGLVALVAGVTGDRRVSEQSLGSGRRDLDIVLAIRGRSRFEAIADVVHGSGLVLVLHLVVGEGRPAGGAPIHQVLPLVHEATLVERNEDLAHGQGQAFVEGEAFAAPVAGGAYLLELFLDDVMVLVSDLPCLLDEILPAELAAIDSPLAQLLFDDVLSGYARVVGSGHPKRRLPEHAMEPDEDILEGVLKPMPHVQDSRDVRGGGSR